MDGNAWHARRQRAERLLVGLGFVEADDIKTMRNDELEQVVLLLNAVSAMAGLEQVDRKRKT